MAIEGFYDAGDAVNEALEEERQRLNAGLRAVQDPDISTTAREHLVGFKAGWKAAIAMAIEIVNSDTDDL